jgi:hypothetical protein
VGRGRNRLSAPPAASAQRFTFRFYGYHPYAHDLADLGWYIAWHERLIAHWRAVLPNPLLTVRLEDGGRGFRRHVVPRARLSRPTLRAWFEEQRFAAPSEA